jgi:hypothetical protein
MVGAKCKAILEEIQNSLKKNSPKISSYFFTKLPVSQFVPLYPFGHLHTKPPLLSLRHCPLFWQGCERRQGKAFVFFFEKDFKINLIN